VDNARAAKRALDHLSDGGRGSFTELLRRHRQAQNQYCPHEVAAILICILRIAQNERTRCGPRAGKLARDGVEIGGSRLIDQWIAEPPPM
jgi:hypothetical protein